MIKDCKSFRENEKYASTWKFSNTIIFKMFILYIYYDVTLMNKLMYYTNISIWNCVNRNEFPNFKTAIFVGVLITQGILMW